MYSSPHHKAIINILASFDPNFLSENNILFGGGTRIVLELDEFRESVDIDLFCIGKDAYRAARSTVTNVSFGRLLRKGHTLTRFANREIRTDRDAIRALLEGPRRPIKLEIINFPNTLLLADKPQNLFPIPCVSREGCFATKLTANADSYQSHIKDILDLCMMRRAWGPIPQPAWDSACDEYGHQVIATALGEALRDLTARHQIHEKHATESLHISDGLAKILVREQAPEWLDELHAAHMVL
jgi:hypothetical protein